jgi:hypothetical protein
MQPPLAAPPLRLGAATAGRSVCGDTGSTLAGAGSSLPRRRRHEPHPSGDQSGRAGLNTKGTGLPRCRHPCGPHELLATGSGGGAAKGREEGGGGCGAGMPARVAHTGATRGWRTSDLILGIGLMHWQITTCGGEIGSR